MKQVKRRIRAALATASAIAMVGGALTLGAGVASADTPSYDNGDGTATVSWFASGYQGDHVPGGTAPKGSGDVNWPQTLLDGQTCGGVIQKDIYHYKSDNQKTTVDNLVNHATLNKPGSTEWTDSSVLIGGGLGTAWTFEVLPACPEQDASADFTVSPATCSAAGRWYVPGSIQTDHASYVANSAKQQGGKVHLEFKADAGHVFANGQSTIWVSKSFNKQKPGSQCLKESYIETSFTQTCDAVTITLHNHSAWIYPVSYSTDGSTPGVNGPNYGPVVDNRSTVNGKKVLSGPIKDGTASETISFVGNNPIKFVVAAGSENRMYWKDGDSSTPLDVGKVTTVERSSDCATETTTPTSSGGNTPPPATTSTETTTTSTETPATTVEVAGESSSVEAVSPTTSTTSEASTTSSTVKETTASKEIVVKPTSKTKTTDLAFTGINTFGLGLLALLLLGGGALLLTVGARLRRKPRKH